jgi:pyruvate dehydrogenase kinase 2/3/4
MYTTAPKPRSDKTEYGIKETPIYGLGFGLPIARLYAKYFQGNLALASVENLGTSAYISLKVKEKCLINNYFEFIH